jgi:hypothetical protein
MGGHRPDVVHVARLGDQIEQLATLVERSREDPGQQEIFEGVGWWPGPSRFTPTLSRTLHLVCAVSR